MLQSSTKRIARNSLMLYIRMLLSMVVGFYTSRVVLQTLGVVDYGIYGLVGGIVSMLGFLNSSMNSATSRFISFDLGIGNAEKLRTTFNTAFQSHLLIALLVFLFAETIGIWIVLHYLDIPTERFSAALWVYQLSVVSTIIGITQAPYSATIIAHEKMDIYAWLEIVNVLIKLGLVWLLQVLSYDHMIVYGVLTLLLSMFILGLNRFYCYIHYPETHLQFRFQSASFRPFFSFMSWNLFSEASDTVRQQGISLLLNRFFGVVVNAASSIAIMVQGLFWAIGDYTLTAFRPQIIQQFAHQDIFRMQRLIEKALQCVCILMCLISVPVIVELPTIFSLWLGTVPLYAVVFCRILLIDNVVGLTNRIICQVINAQGEIRNTSLLFGLAKLICIPTIYLLLIYSFPPFWAYLTNVVVLLVIICGNICIIKQKIPQFAIRSLLSTIARIAFVVSLSAIPYILVRFVWFEVGFASLMLAIAYMLVLIAFSYLFLLDSRTRLWVNHKVRCLLK